MKSRHIRLIVILAVLASVGIIATQVYWVRKAHELNEERFNLNANVALGDVARSLMQSQGLGQPRGNPVEQISSCCFVVHTNTYVEKNHLQNALVAAFARQNILTDFQYGLSDRSKPLALTYSGYYRLNGANAQPLALMTVPTVRSPNYYVGVCFPHHRHYLFSQLNLWGLSSFALLCVMGFFGYLVWVIFKQRQLAEIQKDFVSNMTHEFKTPLASIRLSADVLKNPAILQQPQRLINYATIIANEAAGLTGQVDRVLQMSKAEREGINLQKTDFVVQELLRQEFASWAKIAASKGGAISMKLPDTPIHFSGDVAHLKNVLSNLVDNAVKYCTDVPQIQVAVQQYARSLHISVRDNGVGIDKTRQSMLFDKFFRVPTGNVHDVKGFGIGLNYVQLIARAHGGEATCNSELGKGSTFTLNLPLT